MYSFVAMGDMTISVRLPDLLLQGDRRRKSRDATPDFFINPTLTPFTSPACVPVDRHTNKPIITKGVGGVGAGYMALLDFTQRSNTA